MTSAPLIALAAGGTGGHMTPAHALWEELAARGCEVLLITDRRGAAVPGICPGVRRATLDSGRMAKGLAGKLATGLRMGRNVLRARAILEIARPAAVVGFGGFPAFSALAAARSMGIPNCLHEQNAVLGRTNRLLAPGADSVALSYPETRRLSVGQTPISVTGNPVRAAVARLAAKPYIAPDADGLVRLLVIGGSLGARVLSDVVPDALALLPPHLRQRLQVSQQCRDEDLARVRARYENAGLAVELQRYFEDLPDRLQWAHLVIARAGASTLAELATAGRPAILVPLPSATDDHQTANARYFAESGAGWLMPQPDFTAQTLAKQLHRLVLSPDRLASAAAQALTLGRPDAAARLADLVLQTAGLRDAPQAAEGEASRAAPAQEQDTPSTDRREVAA